MTKEEFYRKYANTPLEHRNTIVNIYRLGFYSLDMVYKRICQIDEIIRPAVIDQQTLINEVEEYLNKVTLTK